MSKKTTKSTPASLTGDKYTLAQVAEECINFQTENELLKERKGTISDHFMSAATLYIKEPRGDNGEMLKDHPFMVACESQEKISKSEAAGIHQWDKIPSQWSQMKSNIKAAYNMGLDITEFSTESSMRKDLNELRKADKESKKTPDEKAEGQVEGSLTEVVNDGNVVVSQRLFAIVEACKDLSPEQVTDAENILEDALESILLMKVLVSEQVEEVAEVA